MINLLRKYWYLAALAVMAIFLLSTLFGTCSTPYPVKNDKREVNELKGKLLKAEIQKQLLRDSLNKIYLSEKKKTDSLIKAKKNTDKELQAEKQEATLWAWKYAELLNSKDTAGAIAVCDSIVQSNKDLIAINKDLVTLYDSTVAGYEKMLSIKDQEVKTEVEFNSKVRQSFDELKGKYDDLYSYNNRLRKKIMGGKVKQKVIAAIALAGIGYFIADNVK